MKKIVMTGGTSFIGRDLLKKLLDAENEVYACVRPNSRRINILKTLKKMYQNLKIIEIDMNQIYDFSKLVMDRDFDVFYHVAWEGIRLPERDDINVQKNNHENSIRALELARILNCKVFLGIGSQAEYGSNNLENNEETVPRPMTPYGEYKLRTCLYAEEYCRNNNIRLIWTRVFSLYGVNDNQKSLIMTLVENMIANKEIALTKCIQKWDFMHVEDATKAIIALTEDERASGIFNVASGQSRPLKDFVEEVKKITKSDSVLQYGVIPYSNNFIELSPNVDKLRKFYDLSTQKSFEEGITEIYLNYKG